MTLFGYLRRLAAAIEPVQAPKKVKYVPEGVTVYFSAPDKPTTETITESGNFQWTKYELLFKQEASDGAIKHYVYKTELYPWGLGSPGGESIEGTDEITPDELKRALIYNGKKILENPEIYPQGLHGTYVNTHKTAPMGKYGGHAYTYDEFNRKFRKSEFYKVVTRDLKQESP